MERFVFIVSRLIHPEVTQQPRHPQTFDELRSLTWILESGDIKLNDNCIMCSNGGHYNNSDGDLEVREEPEERSSALTSAQERASSGNSQGRQGLATSSLLWTHPPPAPSIESLTQQPSITVTLWVWHSTFALTSWPPVTAAAERLGKVRVQGRLEGWLMAERWARNGQRGEERGENWWLSER